MSSLSGFELLISTAQPSIFFASAEIFYSKPLKIPHTPPSFHFPPHSKPTRSRTRIHCSTTHTSSGPQASGVAAEEMEVEVANGITMGQLCDRMIDVFMNKKPKKKQWKKYLVFREEWNKYRDSFYRRCQTQAEEESDPVMKEKLSSLWRKVKKVDEEMEKHSKLLKEIQESPTELNALVAKWREEFTDDFFKHLTLLSDASDGLEDRDAIARLGTRCLAAVGAYDNTLESVETLDAAQAKFEDILNSSTLDAACDKIKRLAKSKKLDSSLILLINSAWASAKESTTMRNEVKEIMYQLFKTTNSSLRSISPKEIKLLKYLLNIEDPEERFSALATAFSPGDEQDEKKPNEDYSYTTPEELHKWIKIMLDAYFLHREETDIREAKKMMTPIIIQRLGILKETIEQEYLPRQNPEGSSKDGDRPVNRF